MPASSPENDTPLFGGLCDVGGLRLGHHDETRRPTGCTVVLALDGAAGGVDVRGAAPGTRETDLLSPLNTIEKVHAIVLSGGSAFGLDVAGGVMQWLDERGIGVAVGPVKVPIVPAAVLFDLWVGESSVRPGRASGYAACDDATTRNGKASVAEGNIGAGCGATVGKLFGADRAMRGGLGQASLRVDGITVAALVVVNAVGDVRDPRDGRLVAGARSADGRSLLDSIAALRGAVPSKPPAIGAATTLAVVATDAKLTKAQVNKLAQMAHDGFARSINPVHTPSDGDTIFALATGRAGSSIDAAHLGRLGALAAEVTAEAVLRGVLAAQTLDRPDLPYLPAAVDLVGRADG
ncbi:P1 family peptidase [Piscinibacter sakaiensis]|uniref:P1 family peptidase n=1 Tax=Piscinibacter sakaiensis TaxID=1547922 RepID=UPI003AACB710